MKREDLFPPDQPGQDVSDVVYGQALPPAARQTAEQAKAGGCSALQAAMLAWRSQNPVQ